MAVLALDIGGSNSHGTLLSGRRILATATVEGTGRQQARRCFALLADRARIDRLALTGGGSRHLKPADFSLAFCRIGEIAALAAGGAYLAKSQEVFVVSMGTGTAFVSVRRGRGTHVGGTGVGGGTWEGLCRLLLSAGPESAERLARTGGLSLDLTVGDISGRGVGRVPAKATAANFGQARRPAARAEIAAGVANLVGEAVGAMACFAARSVGQQRRILLCGRVSRNAGISRRALGAIRLFGGLGRTVRQGEYCAAIGAALLAA